MTKNVIQSGIGRQWEEIEEPISIGKQWEEIKELAKNQKEETGGDLSSTVPYKTETTKENKDEKLLV
jgi:hypothetical protein